MSVETNASRFFESGGGGGMFFKKINTLSVFRDSIMIYIGRYVANYEFEIPYGWSKIAIKCVGHGGNGASGSVLPGMDIVYDSFVYAVGGSGAFTETHLSINAGDKLIMTVPPINSPTTVYHKPAGEAQYLACSANSGTNATTIAIPAINVTGNGTGGAASGIIAHPNITHMLSNKGGTSSFYGTLKSKSYYPLPPFSAHKYGDGLIPPTQNSNIDPIKATFSNFIDPFDIGANTMMSKWYFNGNAYGQPVSIEDIAEMRMFYGCSASHIAASAYRFAGHGGAGLGLTEAGGIGAIFIELLETI